MAADFGPGPEAVAEGRAAIPGTCFSASLTADFGPAPEAAAEGCTAGRGICFLRLSPPTSGLARRRRWRGAQLDRGFAFFASRRRLRAWPGGGGGRVCRWMESLLFMPPRGLARRGRRRGGIRNGESGFHRLWESPTASAWRQWRRGIWTKSLHPCASRQRASEFGPMEAWLEGLLLRLALAGPAGDPAKLCSAAVSGVMLPTVPDFHKEKKEKKRKKRGMERSGPTPSALLGR